MPEFAGPVTMPIFGLAKRENLIDGGVKKIAGHIKKLDVEFNYRSILDSMRVSDRIIITDRQCSARSEKKGARNSIQELLKDGHLPKETTAAQAQPLLRAVLSKKHASAELLQESVQRFRSLKLAGSENDRETAITQEVHRWAESRKTPRKLGTLLRDNYNREVATLRIEQLSAVSAKYLQLRGNAASGGSKVFDTDLIDRLAYGPPAPRQAGRPPGPAAAPAPHEAPSPPRQPTPLPPLQRNARPAGPPPRRDLTPTPQERAQTNHDRSRGVHKAPSFLQQRPDLDLNGSPLTAAQSLPRGNSENRSGEISPRRLLRERSSEIEPAPDQFPNADVSLRPHANDDIQSTNVSLDTWMPDPTATYKPAPRGALKWAKAKLKKTKPAD